MGFLDGLKGRGLFIVKLEQTDGSFIYSMLVASNEDTAVKISLKYANQLATLESNKKSKVFSAHKEVKAVGIENWKECSFKVLQGEKKFSVLTYRPEDPDNSPLKLIENTYPKVAGFKSAFSMSAKFQNLEGKVLTFIRELECIVIENDYKFDMLTQTIIECPWSTRQDGVLEIPATIGGVPVLRIGNYACQNRWQSTGNGLPIFATQKFRQAPDPYIKHLVLPDTVIEIQEGAFRHCNMSTVKFSKNLKYIGKAAFNHNRLTNLELPDSLEQVGEIEEDYNSYKSAPVFSGNFENLILPNSLRVIGDEAFYGCGIKHLRLPENIQTLGSAAFKENSIPILVLPDNLTNIGDSVFEKCKITKVKMPKKLQIVGESAFAHNSITELSLPKSIINIGEYAFLDCDITKLKLPTNLQTLGKGAFGDNAITDLTIPATLTEIPESAFESNKLTKLQIPENVKVIGERAFRLNYIEYVFFNEGLVEIGENAFRENNIKNLDLPSTCTRLGECAFARNNIDYFTNAIKIKITSLYDNPIFELIRKELVKRDKKSKGTKKATSKPAIQTVAISEDDEEDDGWGGIS